MKLIDKQGRLFGKISILDIGAILVILLVIGGIFFFPGNSGSVAQVGVTTKPVELDILVRGLSVRDPQMVIQDMEDTQKTKIVIRNQPYGEIDIRDIQQLERRVAVPQPDGSVKALPDPTNEFSTNMLITVAGEANITDSGPVLGNSKLKIGTPVELEGKTYNFHASVVDVRLSE
ncbi:DUF4330 domain-containing protein [Geitlerinema sp. PCC 9228]|jgi:hypothetical protein|uniref:DUF4330 domain-containing protein n=1 Tax=Geitlerinema sp. PCC 9228 TaxID=111611 RepID=UPI0008F99C8A|nr:DUF4330 domain-containing protein [Geitlerinema sp. PCC 9228]